MRKITWDMFGKPKGDPYDSSVMFGDITVELVDAVMSGERRKSDRTEVEIPGIVEIMTTTHELFVLPAVVRNISDDGILVEMSDKGHLHGDMVNTITSFTLSFEPPDKDENVTVDCRPKRVVVNGNISIGARFRKA